MKKKILLILLIIVGLFTITGCGSSSTKSGEKTNKTSSSRFDTKASVDDLYFKYISTYDLGDTTNGKIMRAGEYNIIVTHQKNMTKEDIIKEKGLTLDRELTINKVKWSIYDYSNDTVTSKIYMHEKDDGLYTVTFAKYVKEFDVTSIMNEFMDEVEFK